MGRLTSRPNSEGQMMMTRECRTGSENADPKVDLPWEFPAGAGEGHETVTDLSETVYSVRLPPDEHRAACPRCGHCWRLSGPTAYANDEPICDLCLLTSEQQLGMVLAVLSVTRMYASAAWASPEDHHTALVELGAFARIYDRFAARFGPLRVFDIGDLRAG